jgi:hypothetical protein
MVLDLAGRIVDGTTKLGFNDFGIQVVMHKWSTAAVDNVDVAYDEAWSRDIAATIAGSDS